MDKDHLELDHSQTLSDQRGSLTSETSSNSRSYRHHHSSINNNMIVTAMNAESGSATEMNISHEPLLSDGSTEYGYLAHIQSYKESCKPNDKSLNKKVRTFYKDQLEFINSLEDIISPKSDDDNTQKSAQKKQERLVSILTTAALITNVVLVFIKTAGAIVSKSLSVISSVVDSIVDLLSSIILLWTARQVRKRNLYQYPTGRARLEPTAVIILSVVMCAASAQVIFESLQTLSLEIDYFTSKYNETSCVKLPDLDMSLLPIIVMVLTIVSKAILFLVSYRIDNPTMSALAEDNRNDVASNLVALVCGIIGSYALRKKIRQEAVVIDPIGALLISIYIISSWVRQALTHVRNLTGITADPSFHQRITHLVYNFRPDVVTKIDTIRAFHSGTKFFVEVDIGLPGSMCLADAHEIGHELQTKLESLDDVERAFVHLDFEFTHLPSSEHKVV